MPDPKLKTAATEIEAILTKHDIAGIVILSSTTHTEYLMELSPTWSCCTWENRPEGKLLRLRANRADYPTKEAHNLAIENSVGLVMGFIDTTKAVTGFLNEVAGMIAEKIEFNHWTKREPRLPPDMDIGL